MKKVYYMERGVKVYYYGEFTPKQAREIIRMKSRYGKDCMMEDVK